MTSGTIGWDRSSHLRNANLVLVRTSTIFAPEALLFCDESNWELATEVENLFSMLRLLGTVEYQTAHLLMGYTLPDKTVVQNYSKLERYNFTRGCLPWPVRPEHLVAAADLATAKKSWMQKFSDLNRVRLFRGWRALSVGLQQFYASDRIHGFVRALEALIYPDVAKTEGQFVHRCSLFAAPSTQKDPARQALQEAYKMRCDVEHVHDWDRSLAAYATADREDIAYWRTRQMETLACTVYARIFKDPTIQQNFYNDASLEQFWQKQEHDIRAAFGNLCDITELRLVKNYDSFGRASLSDWPKGLLESLEPKHGRAVAVRRQCP